MSKHDRARRELLAGVAGAGVAGALLVARAARAAGPGGNKKGQEAGKGGDIPPTEDLMREHGVLRRILLVYDEAARRLEAGDAAVLPVVGSAAGIVHRFVEGYHEKLEEDFVFPKLEKAGQLGDLTRVLRVQHAAGRKLTDAIARNARGTAAGKGAGPAVAADLRSFVRMYAPHAAWEDTELFPAYRQLFTEAELDALGDRFEDEEHKLLGGGGFEGSLREVGDLEKALGIHDLAKFTPA
jgi:hemerythrin-like domain-containing protein